MMAYKGLQEDPKIPLELKQKCTTIEAAIFWAPWSNENNLQMMQLSLKLNEHHNIKMENNQFLLIAKQARNIYHQWG